MASLPLWVRSLQLVLIVVERLEKSLVGVSLKIRTADVIVGNLVRYFENSRMLWSCR